jgi:hypothetical protein
MQAEELVATDPRWLKKLRKRASNAVYTTIFMQEEVPF